MLNALARSFEPSAISEVFSLAARLKDEGQDIIDLSAGEPDFETPDHVKEAAWAAIQRGETKYTPTEGTADLRRAVQGKFRRENGLDYGFDQVMIGQGAKPLLYRALQATLEAGDEVIIPTPCWPSHPGMVKLCGALPVLVTCHEEDGFKLRPDALAAAITDKTKWLIFNSPGNPTGAVYCAEEYRALAEVLRSHPRILVLADDIYEHITFTEDAFVTFAQAAPEMMERTATVNSVSKGYAMTGWRVGYIGGPAELIGAMRRILSQSDGNPCSVSQAAAIAALEGPQEVLAERREAYRRRRDLVVGLLNQTPYLRCRQPEGAFYVYPNCQDVIGKTTPDGKAIANSRDFAAYLLEAHGVTAVPGAGFHGDPYFRLSTAASSDELEEACRRIARASAELS